MTIVNHLIAIVTIVISYMVIPVYGISVEKYWMCSTWLLPILYVAMIPMMGNRHVKNACRKTLEVIRSIIH